MLTAITRDVSPSIGDCTLTYLDREPINVTKAMEQHRAYRQFLASMGLQVIPLPAEPNLPDAVFVEDTAVVVDEVAVITRIGQPKRRAEAQAVASLLAEHRPRKFINHGATLDGGDVVRVNRRLYVGNSSRTNAEGIAALRDTVSAYDYEVRPVQVKGCLHLSTGCSYLGNGTMLVNSDWIDTEPMRDFELICVSKSEPWAAAALQINGVVLLPSCFPETRATLERRGFKVHTIDISEFQKAEGGLSCLSLIFNDNRAKGK